NTTLLVAPLAGAWIERTLTAMDYISLVESHPSRVRGSKVTPFDNVRTEVGRTPRGCVDRKPWQRSGVDKLQGRTPRGCVDRKARRRGGRLSIWSHPSRVRGSKASRSNRPRPPAIAS